LTRCWFPRYGDECRDCLDRGIDVEREVLVERSVRVISKALLKVFATVGEEVGPVAIDSDKAVVDLPNVIGRELVCRESFGRLPQLLLLPVPLSVELAFGMEDIMFWCCEVDVVVSGCGTMFDSAVRPQESE
jgi:hypothetical protein